MPIIAKTFKAGLCAVVALSISSCARAPLKDATMALRPVDAPALSDDLPLEPLAGAIEAEIAFLERLPNYQTFRFGERTVAKSEYLAGLKRFAELAKKSPSREEFLKSVEAEFDFFEVYGDKDWSEVFITGYYQPVVQGSLKRTGRFTRPLYGTPPDLIALDLAAFDPKYTLERKLRGRVVEGRLAPYFTREEIDVKDALKGRKLELVWLDPLDAHNVQVQGSAIVGLPNGKRIFVAYAERNGHRYESIGKFVRASLPNGEVTMPAIEGYLRSLPPEQAQDVLNKNGSYVFFKISETAPEASMGLPPTDGRTIAADQRFFPKGALAFLSSDDGQPFARFVLDQDSGGAITGGGRVDLFLGSGDEAGRGAGVMKQVGRLYYLAPKAR